MNKNYSAFNEDDNFMKDLEELSDYEEDEIFLTKKTNLESNENNIKEAIEKSTNLNLLNNRKFLNFIFQINYFNENKSHNSFESHNTYFEEDSDLIVQTSQCNKFISELNTEINIATRLLKNVYSEIFPELTSIILNPYEYVLTVKSLVNNSDITKVDLSFLPGNIQLSLNVLISTNSKRNLTNEKRIKILNDCENIFTLHSHLRTILKFVENQMTNICPNLTGLVGPNIACKLVTAAGGIEELAKIPAGNVLVMGAKRINTEGFSTKGKLHVGFLGELEEVLKTPEKYRMQLLRKYAGKAVLMARIDAFRKPRSIISSEVETPKISFTNTQEQKTPYEGKIFKDQISLKMNKIIEPQQAVIKKPLPKPDEKPRRKRGGKRMRSIKDKYALTEMRLMKNRIKFGPDGQIEYRESGEGMGLLGVGGNGGKIKTTIKKHKFNTKREKMIALENQAYNQSMTNNKEISGLQSSIAFTPAVGMELINPDLLEKRYKDTQEKYFSATSGFSTVINQKKKGDTSSIYEI